MPLFSIVIPTRNRARYLRFALQACIEQEFGDYEIVVSDNNSTDDTAKLVRKLDNGKVRYFHTGQNLSITDSFEFGILKATGEYVLLLADDEAYKPAALFRLKQVIDATAAPVISFGRTPYIFPGDDEYGPTNTLFVKPFTRNVVWVPSALALHHIFCLAVFEESYFCRALPLSVKSVVHRDIIERIRKIVGCFHLPPTPDWSSCMMMLSQVESVLLLDEHLNIAGKVPESIGPKFKRTRQMDEATTQHSAYFTNLTPLRAYTLYNLCINAVLMGQQAVSPRLDGYRLEYTRYFDLIHNELRILECHGVNVEEDLAELFKIAPRYGVNPSVLHRRGIYTALRQRLGRIRGKIRAVAFNQHRHEARHGWPIRLDGEAWGFANIFECAKKYDRITANIFPDEKAQSLFKAAYGSCAAIELNGDAHRRRLH